MSLTPRILAVNIFALALLAGGFFYLDSYRSRLVDERSAQAAREIELMAKATAIAGPASRDALILAFAQESDGRLRLYDRDGVRIADSWQLGPPNYELRDPASEAWQRHVARFLDRVIDRIVWADRLGRFVEPSTDNAAAWPEIVAARAERRTVTRVRYAPDRTPMLSAAITLSGDRGALLLTENTRDITRIVRAERFRLGLVIAAVSLVSILFSLFLARTIVRPLRRLARAAVRVRLGRARDVEVPRLPERRDEIGMLARALADMSHALNVRIDAIEAFAADVTHELKNPLASLRSAVESLQSVKDPTLQAQLLDIVRDDVLRLDRLITDVAEASRLDAQLSRAAFEPVDLGPMIEHLLRSREQRGTDGDVHIAFARPRKGTAVVPGDASKLVRVVENLLDNAVSFSPPGGLVRIDATRDDAAILLTVEDEGPGVPPDMRDAIFRRFHSDRPESDGFGRHSGLGLAIAKTIVEGHSGTITVHDRPDSRRGARFVVTLPVAEH
ncbi:ATP-binding protein [Sphingomonas sp. LaA6.9]|uniref:sensor histidine kinase n=1 Tax=Sphingomonas sp. LaA6.9 TaxID=2919914 RepID=UPI001F4F9FA3|nr:ATP-binding protein [Sphingomonas sp. LaA6.9]MCJ8157344.1 sensor N-terminal transmembrane domain-containing protein [Sphingomonas sp. LaA6.9]